MFTAVRRATKSKLIKAVACVHGGRWVESVRELDRFHNLPEREVPDLPDNQEGQKRTFNCNDATFLRLASIRLMPLRL